VAYEVAEECLVGGWGTSRQTARSKRAAMSRKSR
jgi:hypothetical protein